MLRKKVHYNQICPPEKTTGKGKVLYQIKLRQTKCQILNHMLLTQGDQDKQ